MSLRYFRINHVIAGRVKRHGILESVIKKQSTYGEMKESPSKADAARQGVEAIRSVARRVIFC
jgi:hypothetical protein